MFITLKKYTRVIICIAMIVTLSACTTIATPQKSIDQTMVNWGSDEGVKRLKESQYKVDFFKLANHFESQNNKLFCGPASAAIVLNALRVRNGAISLPEDSSLLNDADRQFIAANGKWSPLFQRYTQNNIFIKSPKSRALVLGEALQDAQGKVLVGNHGKGKKDRGFQLRQLGALFTAHGVSTKVVVVQQGMSDQVIKAELIDNLRTADDYVIINYQRTVLNQPGGGHLSPLVAYHKASDSFLVMDVTPNKADWVWVKSELLISAMRTFDTVENRGYLLLSEGIE
ncbi:MAG: phytochelatin synthase [Methyloprofundus sp.]|nr:phytochelatin synthase [Methyloprofundus sp.]MBW6453220.1 phytochelatin synthase family protein [Methyloprofundus sp.]